MTFLVRDEADIITSVLDYHLEEGVSRIIVTDNGSVDGTLETLRKYERRDLIDLLIEPSTDYSQHRWVTRMARLAYDRYGADWVVNADADEFFTWRKGPLVEALESIPADVDRLLAERRDFVPFSRQGLHSPPMEMIYRKRTSLTPVGKPLPPKVIHRGDPEVVVSQGNHQADAPGFHKRPVPGPIEVMHYPARSYPQFETKVRNIGSGYSRNKDLPSNKGRHHRRLYEELRQGRLGFEYRQRRFFDDRRLRASLAAGDLVEDRIIAQRLAARARTLAVERPHDQPAERPTAGDR